MGGAQIAALLAGLVCAVQLLKAQLPPGVDEPELRMLLEPPPVATVVAAGAIAVVSVLQLTVAGGLLDALERDRSRIADGQIWRIVTALTTQDGGVAGAVFNLAFLIVLGMFAERVLGRRRAIVGWCAGALAGELAGLAWQPLGAGNSIGNFGLVGALAAGAIASRRRPPVLVGAVAVVLGAMVVLLAGTDIHGAALAAGLVVSALLVPRGAPSR